MVSRPRFLALSEFGPRSLIYHQGRMYRVVRAKLNVGSADHISGNSQLATISSLVCSQCGYGHLGEPGGAQPLVNRCENCDALLTEHDWVRELYRVETVETVAVERISINDEDRQRQGFELQTTYRFLPGPDGVIQQRKAEVKQGEEILAELTYAGQYKSARALVFLDDIDAGTASLLTDKGWQVLNFSDPSQWQAQFAAHPDVFGNDEKKQ